jgi:hypothetical protein
MLNTILACALLCVFGAGQDALEAGKTREDAPATELTALCDKLAQAGSYTFKVETDSEGSPFGGGGRGGRGGGPGGGSGGPITGKFQKQMPVLLQRGDMEAYRQEGRLVYKGSGGEWSLYRRRGFRGPGGEPRGGRGEGQGRGQGGEPRGGGDRGVRGEGGGPRRDRASMMALMSISRIEAPHRALQGIAGKVKDVSRSVEGDKIVYSATLTESGTQAFGGGFGGPGGMRGGPGGRGGGPQGNAPETKGTIHITATKGGSIEAIVVETETHMSFGERSMDIERKTSYTLSDVGSTKVSVPDSAMLKLADTDEVE